MAICWFCYWGWPKPVADIYLKALAKLDGYDSPLKFGPAHVVWEDENFNSALWCLDNFYKYKGDYTQEELDIVRESLIELSKLPEEVYNIEPDDYDGKHPGLYLPPEDVEMVHV